MDVPSRRGCSLWGPLRFALGLPGRPLRSKSSRRVTCVGIFCCTWAKKCLASAHDDEDEGDVDDEAAAVGVDAVAAAVGECGSIMPAAELIEDMLKLVEWWLGRGDEETIGVA